ncbi:MAG: bL35 family ribosomal protein [Patescibacteria group bacterium]
MPKLKTHSGTKDRVKVTKTGKLLIRSPFGNHMLEKKSAGRKRRYAGMHPLHGKVNKNVKKKLGI